MELNTYATHLAPLRGTFLMKEALNDITTFAFDRRNDSNTDYTTTNLFQVI